MRLDSPWIISHSSKDFCPEIYINIPAFIHENSQTTVFAGIGDLNLLPSSPFHTLRDKPEHSTVELWSANVRANNTGFYCIDKWQCDHRHGHDDLKALQFCAEAGFFNPSVSNWGVFDQAKMQYEAVCHITGTSFGDHVLDIEFPVGLIYAMSLCVKLLYSMDKQISNVAYMRG